MGGGFYRCITMIMVVFTLLADSCAAFGLPNDRMRRVARSTNNRVIPLSAATKVTPSSTSTPVSSSVVPHQLVPPFISQRIQNIKDISLQKEILKDVTASEFALQLEVKTSRDNAKIDYEMLISRLKEHLEVLRNPMRYELRGTKDQELIDRIEETKDELVNLETSFRNPEAPTGSKAAPTSPAGMASEAASAAMEALDTERVRELKKSLRVIVREDGSVDWDGATAAGKEVAKFGTELWERLNGKEEGVPSLQELVSPVKAKEPVTAETQRLSQAVSNAENHLKESLAGRDSLKSKLRQERKEGRVISPEAIQDLKRSDLRTKEVEKRLRIFTLDLDVERICVYLQQELESSVEPSDQRVLVAEVALIEKQFLSLITGLQLAVDTSLQSSSEASATAQSTPVSLTLTNPASASGASQGLAPSPADLVSLVDDDELTLLCREVEDLKGRLGLQETKDFDFGTLGVVGMIGISRVKEGLSFYGEGTKILFSDLEYASDLILKAVQGYTLKPREVNAIRRTGKDLLTLIPFTIILIIPLSPVGHVLVFSFIQRFFPDFFPSCYTEKRLNLRKLYAEIERKNDLDILGEAEQAFPIVRTMMSMLVTFGIFAEQFLSHAGPEP